MLNFPKNKTISTLYNSGMPNMANTLTGWEVPITLIKIIQSVSEGDLTETEETLTFKGVWQPLKGEALELKPEGQRSWEWFWLHTKTDLNLQTADKVKFNDKLYKVMELKDYSLNGYFEYHLVKDYESTSDNE